MSDNTSALFRVSLLQSGADDIVPKSIHTDFLLARLRGLIRMRHANFELRVREDTNRALGFHEKTSHFQPVTSLGLIVNDAGNISGLKRPYGRCLTFTVLFSAKKMFSTSAIN